MREIGSEFWDILYSADANGIFPDQTIWFCSGRSALNFIIENITHRHALRSVAVPSWCCESMITPFAENGINVSFYPVYIDEAEHLKKDLSDISKSDAVFVMDYFGYSGVSQLTGYNGIVIRDVTHSVFTTECNDADYYFGSLRKWAGFWTGGFAWSKDGASLNTPMADTNKQYIALREKAMQEKEKYIRGLTDDKGYLSIFAEAESLLDSNSDGGAAERDVFLANRLNVELIKDRRRCNAKILLNTVKEMAIFPELKDNDCPLFVPIMVSDGRRNALREFLIKQKIYCPEHWPISAFHKLDAQTKQIYDEELSLVCDQRYSPDDMKCICEAIACFFG